MRLHRLKVGNFAGIGSADIAFGPGLNVLFGPNDLGKSTLADAIRLALLLPHASTHCEPYIPWVGGGDPVVDLVFATDEQRFWRVRKEFGKGGSSVLQESRNGKDFDDVERARRVDAKLREILCWGIPEPGGVGAGKGLPTSFLATALLSTQADVTAVLGTSLRGDLTGTGKERIAAALQAVAQDPLFMALLRETQARRDEAFTEKGAKKTAKGSVFKAAADRLNEARDEKERLQKLVEESDGVEQHLRELVEEHATRQEVCARAAEQLAEVENLAKQAVAHAAAADEVRLANEAVRRIQKMGEDVAAGERKLAELANDLQVCRRGLEEDRVTEAKAAEALKAAEETARATESDAAMSETVARQQLELRNAAAEQAAAQAKQAIEAATEVQKVVNQADVAKDNFEAQERAAIQANQKSLDAASKLQAALDQAARCDLLERGLAVRSAEAEVAKKQLDLKTESGLQEQLAKLSQEREVIAALRSAMVVPDASLLGPMRKVERDLAGARGVLDVGLVVTVTPTHPPLAIKVHRDGVPGEDVISQALDVEANTELEIAIADIATVRVRGGRRDAQARVRALEERWTRDVMPHLAAATVADLDALDARMTEARSLESRIDTLVRDEKDAQERVAALSGASDSLRDASTRADEARAALGDVAIESIAADLDGLGADAAATLRKRRQQASSDTETARAAANEAATAKAIADERVRALRGGLDAAINVRDAALARYPSGIAAAAEGAEAALTSANAELHAVERELASLRSTIEARTRQLDETTRTARDVAEKARAAVELAQEKVTGALTAHASEDGRVAELRRLRAAEDLASAEDAARTASERLACLPVPLRMVAPEEVTSAQERLARAKRDLESTDRDIQRTQGALEQVGGAVARERLRDANEAFELADRHERELEADYEAWKLLLELMKEADAAQASNLGQALAPAIAGHFEALTEQRYQGVQLSAQLGTDGVVQGGAVRPADRISVGTREQLSTLYRLCLGEYLRTTIVLDDQLVQSDDTRMDWFRELLTEKARSFQIVVFTCRPGDYLAPSAMPDGEAVHADTADGFVRALDLRRAVQRR